MYMKANTVELDGVRPIDIYIYMLCSICVRYIHADKRYFYTKILGMLHINCFNRTQVFWLWIIGYILVFYSP